MKKYNSFNLKWLVLWILIPLLTFSIAFGCAYAYFTATAKDKQGDFSTAMIRVNIADGMTTQAVSTDNDITTYILPGSRVQVSGRVQNTGSARIYVILEYRVMVQDEANYAERGYYTLSGTRIEQNTQGEYITPASEIEAGDDTQFTLSYTFDPEIYDNSFVGKVVNIKVIAHAIQYANIADGVTATNLLIDKGESDMQMLRVSSNDETLGSVSQTGSFLVGQTVTLTASANDNVEFLGWRAGSTDGEWVSDELEYSFTVQPTSPNVYYAIFRDLSTSPLSYTYSGSNATVRATNPSTLSGELRIPSMVNNNGNEYSVTAIYSSSNSNTGAFHSAPITSAYIPSSVTSIGAYAFRSCRNMTDLTIQSNVVSIGQNAFEYCEDLSDVVIPASVTNIGSYAFSGTLYLDTVTFEQGSTISTLSDGIFSISGLQSINIPDSVTSIGSQAFARSNRLRSISLPANLTSIGASAFVDCTSLTSITIPSRVTRIGNSAFSGCTAVSMINFNATNMSDLSEDNNVFMNVGRDTAGTILNVGANVTRIPNYIFCTPNSGANAPNITILNFAEDSVCSSIGTMAFVDCIYLSQITIPENVISIQDDAFWNCAGLTEINFNATNMTDCTTTSDLFGAAGKESTGITVNVGANVTRIPDYLFYPYEGNQHIPNIDSINFAHGSECTEIGDFAFYNCQPLTRLNLPDSLETIGESAFYGATSLLSLTIPESVQTIGQSAFGMASALESLQYNAINANDMPLNMNMMDENGFPSPFFSAGADIINNDLDSNLIIYIGENVQSIPEWMFALTGATNVIYEGNAVTSIGNFAYIGSMCLETITIPESVTNIGYTVFYSTGNVTTLNYNAISANDYDFSQMSGDLAEANLPPFYMVANNISLTVNIGENVEYIPEYMFAMMADSNSLTINFLGSQVTEIGEGAFEYNNEISALTIPSSVQKIGPSVFAECVPSSITFENTEGWSVSESEDMSDSTSVDVTNPTNNSILFTSTYANYYWQREDLPPEPQYTPLDFTIEDGVITGYTGTESNVVIPSTYSIVEISSLEIWDITITEEIAQELMSSSGPSSDEAIRMMVLMYIGGEFYVDGELISLDTLFTRVETGPYPINVELTYNSYIEDEYDQSSDIIPALYSIATEAMPQFSDYKHVVKGSITTNSGTVRFENSDEFLAWYMSMAETAEQNPPFPMTIKVDPMSEEGSKNIIVEGNAYAVTSIGNSAFANNTYISSVTIPYGVNSIGPKAFDNCTNLTSVTFRNQYYWWVSEGRDATRGTVLDMSNTGQNSTLLTETYLDYYWHRTDTEPLPLLNKLDFTIVDGKINSYTGDDINIIIPSTYSLEMDDPVTTVVLESAVDSLNEMRSLLIGGNYYLNNSAEISTYSDLLALAENEAFPIKVECTYQSSYQNYQDYSSLGGEAAIDLIYQACTSVDVGEISGTIITDNGETVFNSREEYKVWYESVTSSEATFNALGPFTVLVDNTGSLVAVEGDDYSVTGVDNGAFYNPLNMFYTEIESITIPESITYIGENAFSGLTGLKEFNYNAINVTDFEENNYTFYNVGADAGGTVVNIGENVQHIPAHMFNPLNNNYNTQFIKEINIPENGSLISIGDYAFAYCFDITNITIPATVTSIGSNAFNSCYGLVEILNKSNLTISPIGTIGEVITDASQSKLTTINGNVYKDYNGERYFVKNIDGSKQITIDNSATQIDSHALFYREDIISLTIPSSITGISTNIITGCDALSSVVVNSGNSVYHSYGNCIIETASGTLLAGCNNSTIPSDGSVTRIGDDAFYRCRELTGISIPECVTYIGYRAFYECESITTVTIPQELTYIGNYAFYGCDSLTTINFHATNLGNLSQNNYVFYDAGGYITINISANVTRIPGYMFAPYSSFLLIRRDPNIRYVNFESGSVCTEIGSYAFYYCDDIVNITLPASLNRIGRYAFGNCDDLSSVTFENTNSWWVSTNSTATSGTSVTLTDSAQNATYLTDTYDNYYWNRNE